MKAFQNGNVYMQITGILARSNGVIPLLKEKKMHFCVDIAKKTMKSAFKRFCP